MQAGRTILTRRPDPTPLTAGMRLRAMAAGGIRPAVIMAAVAMGEATAVEATAAATAAMADGGGPGCAIFSIEGWSIMRKQLVVWTPLLTGLILDQLTKAAALANLTLGQPVPVMPGFNLTLGFNTGASFGMMSVVMQNTPLTMAAFTGAITLILAVLALRARNPWEAAGFALVVGGSLGNIIDRLRQGAVTDFLDVYWQNWHWPTFNMADVAISVGAAAILISTLPAFRKTYDHA